MTLLETYAKRLNVSESVYRKTHAGEALPMNKKIAVATLLNNTNKFLTEAFANSIGTQRADLGSFKKFCLNLTTVAVPSLIAFDLVMVKPMTSVSGYIAYVKYIAGSNKGETKRGDLRTSPFAIGDVDVNYTGDKVVELATGAEFTAAWTPIVKGAILDDKGAKHDAKIIKKSDNSVVYQDFNAEGKLTGLAEGDKIAYMYDNVVIPQNDLPILNGVVDSIALVAKARRIAVYYSQLAAFQAKQDYGFDLGDQLAEQAVGQLAYEIDTEIVNLIDECAGKAALTFNKRIPAGVSMSQHYESFAGTIEALKQKVYDKTKKFLPNYMLIASDVASIMPFLKGFVPAAVGAINGPYLLGSLNGVKVFVSPAIKPGRFVLGVNGNDMMSSVAVYAPYMAVVPTQLLGYADGGMSQGFSTMYATAILNKELAIAGAVEEKPQVITTKAQA